MDSVQEKVLAELQALVTGNAPVAQRHDAAVNLLHDRFSHYDWVGIYMVAGGELHLAAWRGPQATEHVRIPIGEGICGAAARSGQTEIVDDVRADSRYLACFLNTRSEIVVPILDNGKVVGEIDIDSDQPAAFTSADRTFLEAVATTLV